tara:strand:+ start:4710 stop:4820 length:111 start_codon:yes stop_codon:yes gene_type:complete
LKFILVIVRINIENNKRAFNFGNALFVFPAFDKTFH